MKNDKENKNSRQTNNRLINVNASVPIGQGAINTSAFTRSRAKIDSSSSGTRAQMMPNPFTEKLQSNLQLNQRTHAVTTKNFNKPEENSFS